MIMPATEQRLASFGWDETPREVFHCDPPDRIVAHLRRSEKELAAFLRDWCGFDFNENRVDGGRGQ
jgi:hypothetical protein